MNQYLSPIKIKILRALAEYQSGNQEDLTQGEFLIYLVKKNISNSVIKNPGWYLDPLKAGGYINSERRGRVVLLSVTAKGKKALEANQ